MSSLRLKLEQVEHAD